MMRWILLGLYLACSSLAHATTYYVSNQGNDRNNGRFTGQAWRTLDKVNTMIKHLRPGDEVLFRRNDRFTGSLVIGKSGVAGRPIKFGAYGSGNRPIIDGFHRLSGWRSMGGNRWKASYDAPQGEVTNLFINLQPQAIGRYPNLNQGNGGYLTINGGNGRTQFRSNALKGGSWKGAEAVVRARRWILDRLPISQHSGQQITLRKPTSYYTEDGFGFFIVNHLNTLDQEGEWAYHSWSKELFLYTKRDPNTRAVIVPRVTSLISVRDQHDIRIDNLDLWGSSQATIFMRNSRNVVVNNCRIFGSGQNGATLEYTKHITLKYNTFEHTSNNGVMVNQGASYTEIANNTFEHTGVVAGMGQNNNHSYNAIRGTTDHLNIHHNRINGAGHNAISFVGDHINIQYNYLRNFCQVKDDGAGVYAGMRSSDNSSLIEIKNNIIGDGTPAGISYGTPNLEVAHVNGIYLDQRNTEVTITDNTLYGCTYYGLFFHNVRNVRMTRNVLYNNKRALGLFHSDRGDRPMRGISFQNNQLFARQASQELIQIYSAHNDHFQLGTIDHNYYYSPLKREQVIRVSDRNFRATMYSVAQWKADTPYDGDTRTNTKQWPAFEISRYLSGNLLPNGQFTSGIQSWQVWSNQGNGSIRYGKGTMDGGSLVMQFSGSRSNSRITVSPSQRMGSVQKGGHYVLRYNLKSTGNGEQIDAKIATRQGSYKLASNTHYASPKTDRQSIQTFFTINESISDAILRFGVAQNNQQIHIDNVELRRVQTRWIDYNNYVQFLTNPSTRKSTFSLPAGNWKSLKGQSYQGSASLEPFQSLILINNNVGALNRTQEIAEKSAEEDSVALTDDLLHVGAYPNPLLEGDDLTVAVNVPDGPAEVQMYDADGKLLWHEVLTQSTDLQFPRTALGTPGLRLIKVTTDTEEVTEKVIVN